MADDHGRGCSGRRGGHDWRRRKLLVRADGAGASHGLLDWLTEQDAKRGRSVQYSVGFAITDQVRQAITQLPASAWQVALDADGDVREHADVAELTGLLMLPGWPQRMRVIVRREHPHPGAPLSLFEHHDGWRYQAFVTNTPVGQLALLEARHRAHARVEDRIRHAKDTGLGRLPSREYTINQAWLTCVTLAADLTAWLRLLALPEALKTCQPKALRYRLLHVPRPAHPRRAATTPPAPEDLAMGLRSLGNLQPSAGHPRPRLTPVTVPTTHQLRTSKTRTAAPRGAATRPQPPPPPSPAPAPDDNLIPGPVKDRG